jgi:1-acyl-sn-glycerol-3-phosphate acyltransferase
MKTLPRFVSLPVDLVVTCALWTYFTLGFLIFFGPAYLVALVLPGRRTARAQWLNSVFLAGFFVLLRVAAPAVRLRISPAVRQLRSVLIVCNHQSYLDPILLVSLFRRQATIVKPVFFRVPVFGWLLDAAGYLAPTAGLSGGGRLLHRVDGAAELLAQGGILFVFPEGTRSRDGQVGAFKTGAFKLARLLDVAIQPVLIRNTGQVYVPDRFLFRTCAPCTVELTPLARIEAAEIRACSPAALAQRTQRAFVEALAPGTPEGVEGRDAQ